MTATGFLCGEPGCKAASRGIYCEQHRAERAAARARAAGERSARMRQRWAADRDGMVTAIRAGRAPASEEIEEQARA